MPRISAPQPTSLRGGPRPRPPYADHSMDTYDNLSLLHLISCAFRIRSMAVAVDNRGDRTRGYGETSLLDRPCRPTPRAKLLACSSRTMPSRKRHLNSRREEANTVRSNGAANLDQCPPLEDSGSAHDSVGQWRPQVRRRGADLERLRRRMTARTFVL